jgi:hypothetical protein
MWEKVGMPASISEKLLIGISILADLSKIPHLPFPFSDRFCAQLENILKI